MKIRDKNFEFLAKRAVSWVITRVEKKKMQPEKKRNNYNFQQIRPLFETFSITFARSGENEKKKWTEKFWLMTQFIKSGDEWKKKTYVCHIIFFFSYQNF